MTLLTQRQRDGLLRFSYSGSDSSLIYKFVLSPIAQWLVDALIPLWMAPNLITSIGLAFNIGAALLVVVYNPTLSADNPNTGWLALVSALGMFLYQTFDNMDGKQARKTGSQSPLGLLFDHGCDAINAGLSILPVSSSLGLGWTTSMFFNSIPFIPFYTQTWELFYVKKMVLPIINGPSEGLLVAISMMLITFFNGNAKWFHTEHVILGHSMAPKDLMTNLALIGAAITGTLQIYAVIRKLQRDYNGKKGNGINAAIGRALTGLLPFVVFYTTLLLWCGNPNTKAFDPKYRWWSLVLVSSVFVELVSHINLMHITMEPSLCPWERYLVLFTAYLALAVQPWFKNIIPAFISEEHVIVPFAMSSLYVCLRTLHVMNVEAAETLNIYVFKLGPRVQSSRKSRREK